MSFRKTFFVFFICFFLFFSSLSQAGLFKSAVKVFVVKECIEIILKNYGKKIAQQIVLKSKDKLINYIKNNPKMRQNVFDEIDSVANKLISKEADVNKAALMRSYSQSLKNDINTIVPDVVPKGIKLPKNGIWSGEKGNSRFFPSKTSKNSNRDIKNIYDMNNNTGIKYDLGRPVFDNVRKENLIIKGLDGSSRDFDVGYSEIVKRNLSIDGKTFKNVKEVKEYFKNNRLTLHHENDGQTLSIIDRDFHETYRHTGGASKLRGNN